MLDTNIIISGLMRRNSSADLLRQAWELRRLTLVTSEWQLDELGRVSRYPRLRNHLVPHEVGRLVSHIRRRADIVVSLPTVAVSPDPDDDPIVATAIAGQAQWLVTGDEGDLLVLGKVNNIFIVATGQLLELMK